MPPKGSQQVPRRNRRRIADADRNVSDEKLRLAARHTADAILGEDTKLEAVWDGVPDGRRQTDASLGAIIRLFCIRAGSREDPLPCLADAGGLCGGAVKNVAALLFAPIASTVLADRIADACRR